MKKLLLFTFALFLWTGAWAQDVNHAHGVVPELVSGTTHGGTLADITDDNDGTSWQVNTGSGSSAVPVELIFDLESSKTIDMFRIVFTGDRHVKKFTLYESDDKTNWTKIDDYNTGVTEDVDQKVVIERSFEPQKNTRYIKYESLHEDAITDDQYGEKIESFALLQYGSISIPAIVADSHKLGIYSFDLGNATGYSWADWGSSTGRESIFFLGKQGTRFSNFTYYGSQFQKIDATSYAKLRLEVYPYFTGTLAIIPIIRNSANTGNETEKGLQFDVTENQWNHLELDFDDLEALGVDMSRLYQIKYADHVDGNNAPVNGDGSHSFIIGNVYLYGTPIVDTEKPTMVSVTVASTKYRYATLTVKATDNNETGTLTYKVKNSSDEVVATGSAVQDEDATVVISGLTASTDYLKGYFKVTATDHAGNESNPMDVPAFSTDAATGQIYTNGNHEILVQPRHYAGTFDYELIVISEEAMTNFSNSYWKLNGGPGGTLMNYGDITLSEGGKVMTVKVRSTTAPVMDTPLYINMPGEVTFKESDDKNPVYNWIEVASEKTYDVMVNGDKAVVVGTISASNLSDFQTAVGNTSVIDISGAAIDESIDKLTTNNANAIFQYADAASASAATKTTNSVYYFNVRFYGAPNGLTFVDNPASVPLLPEKAYCNIADGKKVVINREIAAGKYVTTYMGSNAGGGMEATLETGLEAYELAKAEAGQLTFTKVNSIAAGKGYVIHNTTSGALTLTWQTNAAQVYLDNEVPNQNPDDVEAIDGVKILGTLHTITTTTDGNQWLLSDNQIKKGNGAKISPYRAYFTGVTLPASGKASAVFVDGETTKIGSINANGEINVMDGAVYNLAGQRVAHPTKGLYIVNGKKVIIK